MVAGMVMPLNNLKAIYEHLFRDGVMVAKKDKRPQTMHPEIPGVENLHVIRAMGSLKSRGYVKETFAWKHFYWYLTNAGIVYLRDYLHLPPEIVPTPLQRVRRPAATLAIARRAERVQSVQGPTSYVPKPGKMGAEALMDRQGYRRKMTSVDEPEITESNDRTPRFRGRPMASSQIKPRGSWESREQPMLSETRDYTKEMEPSVRRKIAMHSVSHIPSIETRHAKPVEQEKMVELRECTKATFVQKPQKVDVSPDVSTLGATEVESKSQKKPKEEVPIKVSHETTSTATDGKTVRDAHHPTPSKPKVEKTQKTLVMKNMQDVPIVSSAERTIAVESSVFSVRTEAVKEKPKEEVFIEVSQQTTSTVIGDSKTAKDVPRHTPSKPKVEKTQKTIVDKSVLDVSNVSSTVGATADKSAVSSFQTEAAKEKPVEEVFIKVSKKTTSTVADSSKKDKDALHPITSELKVEKTQQTLVTKNVQDVQTVSSAVETTVVKTSVFSVSTETVKELPKEDICVNVSQETTFKGDIKMDKDASCPTLSKPKVEKSQKNLMTKNVQDMPAVSSTVEATAVKSAMFSVSTEVVKNVPKEEVYIKVPQEKTSTGDRKMDTDAPHPTPSKPKVEKMQKTTKTKSVQDIPIVSSVGTVAATAVESSVVSAEAVKEKPKEDVYIKVSQETTFTVTDDSKMTKDAPCPTLSKPKVDKTEKTFVTKNVQDGTTVSTAVETITVKSSVSLVSNETSKEKPKEELFFSVSQDATSKVDSKEVKDAPHHTPILEQEKKQKTTKIKNVQDKPTISSTAGATVFSVSDEAVKEEPKEEEFIKVPQETTFTVTDDSKMAKDAPRPTPSKSKVEKTKKSKKTKNVQDIPTILSTVEATAVESSVVSVCTEAVNKDSKKEVCINISQETTSTRGNKMDKDAHCPTPSKPEVEKMQKTTRTKIVQEQPIKNETTDVTNETSIAPHHVPAANADEVKPNTSKCSSQVPVKSLESAMPFLPKKEEHLAIQIAEKKPEINLPLHTIELSVEESVSKSAITAVPPTASSTVHMTDKQQRILGSQKTKKAQEASKDDNTCPLKVQEKVEIPYAISTAEVKAEVKGNKPGLSPKSAGAEVKITTADSSKTSEVVAQTLKSNIETPKQIDSVQQKSSPAKQTEEPVVTEVAKVAKDVDAEDASKPSKAKKKKQKSTNKSSAVKQDPPLIAETKVTEVKTTAQNAGQVDLLKVEGPEQVATNDSAKTSPEGMPTVESVQPTAVQNEAPAHKGEVEPAQPLAEKREVLKGKTSSSQRQWEAPAASASAAAASAQLTPLPEQGEPPSIAQHTAASDTQQSTENQNRLSDSKAPSQPVITGPLPANEITCDVQNQSTDDAMRKKIVVVEEVIEVQQITSPVAGQPSTSPLPEIAGDDLDYDVLEELAIERGLLEDPEETSWDHSLQEPEGKTFPNFIEDTWRSYLSPGLMDGYIMAKLVGG
ncbi:Plectin [Anabarilius grahami]|uniref:Plectin n=1 Tax=Anabarilius grahami TaxID=495550 RepID=A0A3N0Y3Q3_ANAGA|nr:Plectin [Anabarilius grahami]